MKIVMLMSVLLTAPVFAMTPGQEKTGEVGSLREDRTRSDGPDLLASNAKSDGQSGVSPAGNMVWCPNCERNVPIHGVRKTRRCVICGGDLDPEDPVNPKRRKKTPDDLDGDGISNEDEKRYGLDPEYPGDALLDADSDGFSNLYEITVSKTDPRDTTSHPPLWLRLRYVKVAKVKLDIEITGVNTRTKRPDDPKTWEVSIKWTVRNPKNGRYVTREEDFRIGYKLTFCGHRYTVTDIKLLDVAEKSYAVTLETGDVDEKSPMRKLTVISGQDTCSPEEGVVLEDVGAAEDANGKRYLELRRGQQPEAIYNLLPGDVFTIGATSYRGRRRIGEDYRLESFDAKKKIAVLVKIDASDSGKWSMEDANGNPMIVTAQSGIDKDCRVTIPKDRR